MKASDYASFARGQHVMVQLKGHMCMAAEDKGEITLAEASPMPLQEWANQLVVQYVKETGEQPTPEEVQAMLDQNPQPKRPVMAPVLFGTLHVRGELLVVRYDDKVEVSLDPDDIKHVSVLVGSVLER
jgi:hypothetical protein